MKKSRLIICFIIVLTILFLSGCKKDETPPTIYNVPDEGYSIAYGEDVDFEQLIKDDEVTAIDEVDGEVDYEIDSSEIDINIAGIYYLYITAYDKAENGKQAIVPIEVREPEVDRDVIADKLLSTPETAGGYITSYNINATIIEEVEKIDIANVSSDGIVDIGNTFIC